MRSDFSFKYSSADSCETQKKRTQKCIVLFSDPNIYVANIGTGSKRGSNFFGPIFFSVGALTYACMIRCGLSAAFVWLIELID